ncbi:hypothetical protein Syun_007322 [Stephania yunnanensis]|uniref:DYW domain-containing protein n=1 Tax=Stephania yunnanensis TaxID=152371 RepID=A0AAP0KYJ7_9MAGN
MAATNQPILLTFHPPHHHLQRLLSSINTLPHLKQLHAHLLRTTLLSTSDFAHLAITSLTTLSSSSSLDYALSVFTHTSPFPDTRLCNSILRQLAKGAEPERAVWVYARMRGEGRVVDGFSFAPVLKALARMRGGVREGAEVHGVAVKMGFGLDPFVQTGLVRMYAASGCVFVARQVFDEMRHRDVVAWNVMIDGYCQGGLYDDALMLFEEMKKSDVKPDKMILATVLSACNRSRNLSFGREIHDDIRKENVEVDFHLHSVLVTMYVNCEAIDTARELYEQMPLKNLVAATSLVMAYSKLGKIEAARSIFDELADKDLVAWSAMIACYAESDCTQEALKLFHEMEILGVRADQVTVLSVISAIAKLGLMDKAKWIHNYVEHNGFGDIVPVNNALIDMYAKCGSLVGARGVFDKMSSLRNVISWTSMIAGHAIYGDADGAFGLFDEMKAEGIMPNNVTFVSLLYACSHVGAVKNGRQIFASMISEYNIAPSHEHYGCMVDLLGRANLLKEALHFIESMPFPPNVVIWGSLLSACRLHGEVELGEFAAKKLLELDPEHDGAQVLLSNIYAKAKRWEDVVDIRQLMKNRGVMKEKGSSRIELEGKVHEFLMFDRTHEHAEHIYGKLDEVVFRLKLKGYVPDLSSVLVDLEEEEKKEVVLWHSEKLALCYGLLNSKQGSYIRIVKNLRVCEDCHTFMKLVSKVYEREIIVRDRTRFHHYRDGICSCKDYW